MNLTFDPYLLITSTQSRGKVYSWSQLYNFTSLLPSKINHQLQNQPKIDPYWLYTQSGKNYNQRNRTLELYPEPNNFELRITTYGLLSRQITVNQVQTWFSMFQNSQWYRNQIYIRNFVKYLYLLPGIKNIYLVGSSQQEISSQFSDIDIAVQCHKNWVLSTRLWLKILLKLKGQDVHPFFLEIKTFFLKIINNKSQLAEVENRIWNYKRRQQTKIDAGLLFEDISQIHSYFEKSERNLWIFDMALLPNKFAKPEEILNNSYSSIIYQHTKINLLLKSLFIIIKILLIPFFLLSYPIAFLQLVWLKLNQVESKQLLVKYNFCCFYPRYPSYSFLTKLESAEV
ncbi:MAG: hypothetical protein AAGF07_01580 [Patescibacteria group bacterium]